ncbi:hypothetical protein [Megasphaera vaginalis (ex Srinivasan et al. 2021)]|uniref:DUF1795 domain-containing protein n=1 Tax=Megasphaera vaginalis (ex Srinivasan et al. 2021) TaxID=1111454 RepID=U7UNC8_9FIRM|nr:hypothetical protein [Megasphaera vaginalis (ex Srinivasan et al. 2021)]ERT60952.1 hypothetical protein HMPREF1250_0035 [Megasphaera vaginalis (ex Srinivasan et al. 2021)]
MKKMILAAALAASFITGAAAAETYHTYTDRENRFTLSLPDSFTVVTPLRREVKLAAVRPDGKVCTQISEEPWSDAEKKQGGNRLLNWQKSYLAALAKDAGISRLHHELTVLNGRQCLRISYTCTLPYGNDTLALYVERIIFTDGDKIITVMNSVEEKRKEAALPLFDTIAGSFFFY